MPSSMGSEKPAKLADENVRKLFRRLLPQIPVVVRQVCASLGHQPQKMDFEDFVERIVVLLKDKDYRRLRSFRHKSSPETWLFTVAKHEIGKQLRGQSRMVCLEDLPPDSFIFPPNQEVKMMAEEQERMLLDVRSKLTDGETKLFDLLREDKSDPEIAEALKIKIESVWAKKSAMIKKIREMLRQDNKMK